MTDEQKIWAVKLCESILSEAPEGAYGETMGAVIAFLQTCEETPPPDAALLETAGKLMEADKTEPMLPGAGKFIEFVYTDAAEGGDVDAANSLGCYYYTGRGSEQNYDKAEKYYTIAAAKGHPYAAENLGYIYYYGRTAAPDYEKAFLWFAKGAFYGMPRSLYKIGDMYRYGKFVAADGITALRIYEKALHSMSDEQMREAGADVFLRLADCHWEGIGTEVNADLALTLYQQAERLFTARLREGDFLIRKSYEKCVQRQAVVRAAVQATLPGFDWAES